MFRALALCQSKTKNKRNNNNSNNNNNNNNGGELLKRHLEPASHGDLK